MPQESLSYPELLAYLRYEICTPINSMIVYSSLLLEDLDTPTYQASP